MIFHNTVATIQSQVTTNAQLIESLQQQIETLREQNLDLENHLQALGTAEAASQSAVEQVRTAVAMIKAIDPNQLEVLKAAIDSIFEPQPQSIKLLSEALDDEPASQPTEEQIDDEPSLTITEIVDSLNDTTEIVTDALELTKLSIYELRDMCTAKGIAWKNNGKNFTKKEMLAKLKNSLDVAAA